MKIANGWLYKWNYVPQRKGSYFTIEQNEMTVDATVVGWLDKDLQPTTKKKAIYINARRFSYNNKGKDGLPQFFAVELLRTA